MADAAANPNGPAERRPLGPQEQYCRSCGGIISNQAFACPRCGAPTGNPNLIGASPKSRLAALLLCFFFGVFGIHRFYVGKVGTGLLQLFTLGGFGVWALVDFIMIIVGAFTDKDGLLLVRWS